MEQPQVEMIVRLTARLSAAAFVGALLASALATGGRTTWRGPEVLLGTFLLAHTIHFAAVLYLAALTGGRNIEDRGGWPLMLVVATLFYLSSFAILSAWRQRSRRQPLSFPHRLAAHTGILFIVVIYLNSYVARAASAPVFRLAVAVMSGAALVYFISRFREASEDTDLVYRATKATKGDRGGIGG